MNQEELEAFPPPPPPTPKKEKGDAPASASTVPGAPDLHEKEDE